MRLLRIPAYRIEGKDEIGVEEAAMQRLREELRADSPYRLADTTQMRKSRLVDLVSFRNPVVKKGFALNER